MTSKHVSNKNKKDMDVQACVTPNSVFWLGLADFSCPTFAVKYFCRCLEKTKIKKQASFCALMDHCEFFWCKCIWNQRPVLLLVVQLF